MTKGSARAGWGAQRQALLRRRADASVARHVGPAPTGESRSRELLDRDFHKIWLKKLEPLTKVLAARGWAICIRILTYRSLSDNVFAESRQVLMKKCGASLGTLKATLAALEKHDIIKRVPGTTLQMIVNPAVIFRGQRAARLRVIDLYRDLDKSVQTHPGTEASTVEKPSGDVKEEE